MIGIDDFEFKISQLKLSKTHHFIKHNLYKKHLFQVDCNDQRPNNDYIRSYKVICSKCNIKAFAIKTIDNEIIVNSVNTALRNLTCDEIIIKNIIE